MFGQHTIVAIIEKVGHAPP